MHVQKYIAIALSTVALGTTAADGSPVVLTRSQAVRAQRSARVNFGTATRYSGTTAGSPAYAAPIRPSNHGYATHARVLRRGNFGVAAMADPKAKAVKVEKVQRKKGSKKKK